MSNHGNSCRPPCAVSCITMGMVALQPSSRDRGLIGFCALQRARPGPPPPPPPPPATESHVLPLPRPPPSAPIAESGVDEASLASFGGCSLSVAPPPGHSVDSPEKQSSGLTRRENGEEGPGEEELWCSTGSSSWPNAGFYFLPFHEGHLQLVHFSTASCQQHFGVVSALLTACSSLSFWASRVPVLGSGVPSAQQLFPWGRARPVTGHSDFRSFLGFRRRFCGLFVKSWAAISGFQHLLLSGEAKKFFWLTDLTPVCLSSRFNVSSMKLGSAF